jgi:GNAT superfamily N-acetyltransferase
VASIEVRALNHDEHGWASSVLVERWGATRVVSRGRLHEASELPAFVALLDGEPAGLLTYRFDQDGCEVVTIDSLVEGHGLGSALLAAARSAAEHAGAHRLWLITTNDNVHALGFYQRRGFELAALHRGALARSRELKPEIPLRGRCGIPLRDELELELRLGRPSAAP